MMSLLLRINNHILYCRYKFKNAYVLAHSLRNTCRAYESSQSSVIRLSRQSTQALVYTNSVKDNAVATDTAHFARVNIVRFRYTEPTYYYTYYKCVC